MAEADEKKEKKEVSGVEKKSYPLRLEWIAAGTLTENPSNWRKHSAEQMHSLSDLLEDPDIGWAGACLFNERTKRLIDGHARRKAVSPETPVPVLVGNWSEDAERKILATLDPVGAMAEGDLNAYKELQAMIDAESLWVRDLIHNTTASLSGEQDATDAGEGDPDELGPKHPELDQQPFEHLDYLMLMFRDDQDFQQACELLGIKRVKVTYPGGMKKVGLGRIIDGPVAIKKLTAKASEGSSKNADGNSNQG
ncbi:MAG: hypothetical protein JXD22_11620 [Sedimentisphaerales bacterium]|nr:hypothetical protein [Sedimentisphaerales bacterium]